ncbi:PD-(D/E)XK nuclease family protein [Candidatus Woesearchaeota archaeon]|nr:MAG: PD-(D/E)XK nuclease family protein [Candidatus Woesearchaeota archaeon]
MPVYSHSKLSTFEQCRLKFKFNYIDKIKTEIEQTVEAFLGSLVHATLEKLYNDLKFQKINSLQDLLDFFNKEWEKNWNDSILIVRDEYDKENYRKMGEKFITDYYNRFKPFDQDRTIATEQHVIINIGDYTVEGYIDRIADEGNGVYAIHDYKTSNTLMTQDRADEDRQLALYALAVKELYKDCKEVKLIWHFLAFDKDVVSKRTDEQLMKLKSEIISLIKQIENNTDFPPSVSRLCDWCEFRPICPQFKHLFELEKKEPNEFLSDSGVKLVNEYAETKEQIDMLEEKLEKIREALVAFAKKENVEQVFGSNVIASIKEYPKLSYPKRNDPRQKEFLSTIKQVGLWGKLATVDVYELTKMINRGELHEDIIKLLEKFIDRDKIQRVSLKKKY